MRPPFPLAARRILPSLALLCLWSAACPLRAAPAAAAAVAKGTDAFGGSGGFEKPQNPSENLWDGVNSDGTLAGFTFSASVVTERGSFGAMAMPPSVAFVDLNGDGKPDLVTADPTGFFRFYPNVGTAAQPKFTNAELIPIFVSSTNTPRDFDWRPGNADEDSMRMCPRLALADWRRSGLLDLIIGNYLGEVFFLPNVGTAKVPAFRTPAAGIKAALVPTNDQGHYWGNLLAPAAYQWVGSGKTDLLLGEGTYSANAVHLFENLGDSVPKFSSARRGTVAYGDGREQLIPTVADFNGDGFPDLVIADRTGEVGMYLSPGKPTLTTELKRTSTISFGATTKLGGVTSPYAVDFNGDGLIDLLLGLPNGHIAVSLNTGTKTEPKFGPLVELKGTPRFGRNVKLPPTGWHVNTWSHYGNALAYVMVVDAQDDPEGKPPEGANCLKAGYWPAQGASFPMPETGMPGGSHHFTLYHDAMLLNTNKSYKLTFKVKGSGMEKLHFELQSHYHGYSAVDRVEKDERGGAHHASARADEWVHIGENFSASSNWSNVEATLVPRYKDASLQGETTMPARFYVDFYSTSLASQLYFDDFRLVEQ